MAPTGPDSEIDAELARVLGGLLGPQRLRALLGVLAARLERINAQTAGLPVDGKAFVAIVHQSRGSASTLGLTGLTRDLDRLENLAQAMLGDDVRAADTHRQEVTEAAQACLEQFTRARAHLDAAVPGLAD